MLNAGGVVQFDRQHQPLAADFDNGRVDQQFFEERTHPFRIPRKILPQQDIECSGPGHTGQRVPSERGDMPQYRFLGQMCHAVLGSDEGTHGQPATQGFAKNEDVGYHTGSLEREGGTGPSESGLYFIEHEQGTGLEASNPERNEPFVSGDPNPGITLNGFHDHRCRAGIDTIQIRSAVEGDEMHVRQKRP